MKSIILGLAFSTIGCAAFTTEAATSDISWNYVGAGYTKVSINNIAGNDVDLNGYQLNGSYLLSDNLYLHASYYDVSGDLPLLDDIMGLEFEASEWQLGLGYRHAVYDNIDSFFQAGYVRSELGVVGFENDTLNGFQAAAGFRYKVLPDLELSAALRYNDSSDSDSSTYGDIGARYSVTAMFDLYLNYQFDSDVSLLGAGVAVKF